jgi:prepilin-type N-terminal cleavage/methylation domain-containing protein
MRTMRKQNTRLLLIKYLLSTQAGFSLIESLVAVVVVAILLAAIVPMVVLSTASRVQARRVDLATQAARSYVDGVRAGVINIIDPVASFPYIDDASTWVGTSRSQYFQNVPAPTNATVAALNTLPGIKIDTNGDGFSVDDPQDLVIQPMRSGAPDGNNLDSQGFYMAVRVYRADAFQADTSGNLTAIKPEIIANPPFGLQTGNNEADCPNGSRVFTSSNGSLTCPLVVMKVDVYPTDSTLDQIKGRL